MITVSRYRIQYPYAERISDYGLRWRGVCRNFKKSSGLSLYSRTKVSGTAHPLYAAVAAARENSGSMNDVSVLVLGVRLELT